MVRTLTFVRVILAVLFAGFLVAGCEFTTSDPSEGTISLAELQGQTTQAQTQTQGPTQTTSPPSTSSAPVTGGSGIGPTGQGGGFLWKPVSESTGKLAVLLPPQYTGKVSGVYIAGAGEGGAYGGVGNGGRTHWRFSKPGAQYGNDVTVVANLKAGGAVHWVVPRGSSRTEY